METTLCENRRIGVGAGAGAGVAVESSRVESSRIVSSQHNIHGKLYKIIIYDDICASCTLYMGVCVYVSGIWWYSRMPMPRYKLI